MPPRESRTAPADRSIWLEIREETFREHLVTLEERTNTIPMDPMIFSPEDWSSSGPSGCVYTLPLKTEQQVADDFACLVAVEEGAQSVAAVCIEEHVQPAGILFRFAAVDLSLSEDVKLALQAVADVLMKAASTANLEKFSNGDINHLYDLVITLHQYRLLARLRSSKWDKPRYLSKSHKKPLWQDFPNLVHRTQFAYTKQEKALRQLVESHLDSLSLVYKRFESAEDDLVSSLKRLVNDSYEFCSNKVIKEYLQRLQSQTKRTSQIAAAIKSLHQIQKIATYRRASIFLVNTAHQYPTLFQNITIAYLDPYQSVPTSIGYHEWAKTCHVHAEVQLAVHYDMNPQYQPRIIGTSKWLCYLCHQFLQAHKLFFPSKTHGQLYDQWTIPDLCDFNDDILQRYRNIIKAMDSVTLGQLECEPELTRLKPMTSCAVD